MTTNELDPQGRKICGECKKELKSAEEKDFGQCDSCCAWKYRELSE
jgi:uncharacterized CHY-type Zn-finger protein